VPVGDIANHEPERRQIVRGRQRLGVAKIDLVLPGRNFMMARFDFDPIDTRSFTIKRRISSARSTGV